MTKFRPNETDVAFLRPLAEALKLGNAQLAAGKKQTENAKESIARWLKENRGIDIETLSIGDMVLIEELVLLEVGKQNKFDEADFAAKQSEIYESFKREKPVRKFKALV